MFEGFYGLAHTPFTRDIATDQLYVPVALEETLKRLEYAAERQLFAVVTGDCGTGKTTTIRRFKEHLSAARSYLVMYVADSKLTPRNFYKGLPEQLGCEAKFYRGDAKRQLHYEIELMKGIQHLLPVVVVDELCFRVHNSSYEEKIVALRSRHQELFLYSQGYSLFGII